MHLQISSYDYDAPINEFYEHTVKSRRLCELHEIILSKFEPFFYSQRVNDREMIEREECKGKCKCKVHEWGK